jgi:HlyD family type I secretion membrane fusion protein
MKTANSSNQKYSIGTREPKRVVPMPSSADVEESGMAFRLSLLSFGFLILMLLMLLGLLAWSWYGTIEESVPGVGQMIPEGKLRRVMAPFNGIVSELYVSENQLVKAGQRLIVLDPEAIELQKEGFQNELALLQQESLALQAAASGGSPGKLDPVQRAWLESTRRSYQSQSQEIAMQVEAAKHAYQQAIAQQKSLRAIVDSKSQQVVKLKTLYEQGGLPKKELMDAEQDLQLKQGELEATTETVSTRKAEIEQAESRRRTLDDKYRQDLMGRIMDHTSRMSRLRSQIAQAQLTVKREVLTAPISGTVNEQAVHGKGEVVTGGTALLTIVPENTGILAEIKVTNRDLSYIRMGQKVSLKMEAFPNQRFGRLWGKVVAISPSSHTDAEGNQFFMVKVRPDRSALKDETGKLHPIRSGMSVTADIITREKSILSFFTESLHERIDNAFREPSTR